jgi:hypothetical protein
VNLREKTNFVFFLYSCLVLVDITRTAFALFLNFVILDSRCEVVAGRRVLSFQVTFFEGFVEVSSVTVLLLPASK